MKQVYVKDLQVNTEITEFFMAKKAQIKTGSNGKEYFDVELCDMTGSVSGKKWDIEKYPVSFFCDKCHFIILHSTLP